jgi:hypothetical protein
MNWKRIIAVFVFICFDEGNSSATVLDLLVDTPGLQVANQNQIVDNVQDTRCIHVIVPGTRADEMVNTDNGGFYAAINCEGNIHFPTNGVQPTTPEAVEYSCANIDNQENSPITEWHMMMFGVIPFQNTIAPGLNDYIKAV